MAGEPDRLLGFDLGELEAVYETYLFLRRAERNGELPTVAGAAKEINKSTQKSTGWLYQLLRRFNEQTKNKMFDIRSGSGGTHAKTTTEAIEVLGLLRSILRSARSLLNATAPTLSIGAGVTACVSCLPRLLQNEDDPETAFDLHSVIYHRLDARREQYDICLYETLAEPTQGWVCGNEPDDKDRPRLGYTVVQVPLKLMILWTHKLAKNIPADGWASVEPAEVIRRLQGHRIALVEQDDDKESRPRPHYPKELFAYDSKLRIVRCSTHALTHALVMTGSAVSLSTPLLLTEEQRREIEVIDLPKELQGYIRFKLECPEPGGLRDPQQNKRIRTVCDKLEELIRQHGAAEPPSRYTRQAWHISHKDDVPTWVRADISWCEPTEAGAVLRGRYIFRGDEYLLDGSIARREFSEHIVFKAIKRGGGNVEEFTTSYVFDKGRLADGRPVPGIWTGRRWTPSTTILRPFLPSLGFSVLLDEHHATPTLDELNALADVLRLNHPECSGLPLGKQIEKGETSERPEISLRPRSKARQRK